MDIVSQSSRDLVQAKRDKSAKASAAKAKAKPGPVMPPVKVVSGRALVGLDQSLSAGAAEVSGATTLHTPTSVLY